MGRLFQELRRRNMFRVAGVYAVIGWLLIQIGVAVLPTFEAPPWVLKVFIALIFGGLPISLILAWAFEMTPEGMKRTAIVPDGASTTPKTGRKLDYLIIGGLALVGVIIVADRTMPKKTDVAANAIAQEAVTPKPEISSASIAVLPFVDMSAAGDQEYFADGIAEEILNLLAKSKELKVAGRTSSFQFKGRNEDLRIIGDALGVATILEGSLRKAGERVRITAQLIRSSDGFHLWSETFDGDLSDIFALQEEIAIAIAAELRAPLGLDEGALAGERTQNLKAYEHYLAGMAQYAQRGDALIEAIDNFQAAVALDPEFAAAWAGLANSYTVLPGWVPEYLGAPTDRFLISSKARYAAMRAQELNPDLAQSLHAISNVHNADLQWESAEKAISRAYALAPNSTAILEDYFEFLQSTGQWEKALPIVEHMVEVDPLMSFNWINLGWARWDLRDYEGAAAAFEKSLELDNPLDGGAEEYVALLLSQGDADAAASVLADNDWISSETRNCLTTIIERYRVPSSTAPLCERYISNAYLNIDIPTFSLIIGGQEGLLKSFEVWLRDGRAGYLNSNSEAVASGRDSAQYKKLIRDSGFERYWRNTSWPTHCRPIGDDDFECTSGTYSED